MMPWDGWPADWNTPNWGGQGASGLTGSDIVYACIDLNARVTADMPVSIRTAGLPAEARPWLVNPQPEIYASWADFWQQLWWDFQGNGEAIVYATSRFADGFPRTFLALEPALSCGPEVGTAAFRHPWLAWCCDHSIRRLKPSASCLTSSSSLVFKRATASSYTSWSARFRTTMITTTSPPDSTRYTAR